tara:strand:+ start:599 stop:3166 length:2568 start_codon:yes stop_codon:yes gene_type:complete
MKVTASLRNEKSILAKLMSTENIDVRHTKVPTAAFDPDKRILYLPIWKEMNAAVYDLFVSHEVGHALYTPAEGWHTAKCERGMNFKSYLNIIEDVRIERKIKLKYPGAKAQMYKGYQVLVHDLDFFGLHANKIDVNTMNFIDRINVHYKSGATEGVKFSKEEMETVERLNNIDTWDEVVEIASTIYDADSESETEMDYMEFDKFLPQACNDQEESDCDGEEEEKEDSIEDYKNMSESMEMGSCDSQSDDQEKGDEENNSQASGESDQDSEEVSETDGNQAKGGQSKSSLDQYREELEASMDQFKDQMLEKAIEQANTQFQEFFDPRGGEGAEQQPYSFTDREYRENEEELVDESARCIYYANAPTPKLEESLIPYKKVMETYDAIWDHVSRKGPNAYESIMKIVPEFINDIRNENSDIVSYLCKEFEMKKRAHQYKRQRLATSGRIDMNRLHQYKTSDSIFRRITAVPDGKNHGLVMYIDYSGSMAERIVETVIQTYVLLEFCRRAGIPYRVVSFTDYSVSREIDNFKSMWMDPTSRVGRDRDRDEPERFYDYKAGDAVPSNGNVHLVEWFHDKMSAAQHKRQLVNWFSAILQYDRGIDSWCWNKERMTPSEKRWEALRDRTGVDDTRYMLSGMPRIFGNLWGTPLNDAILHGVPYANNFKEAYKLECLHSIFLTDGESSGTIQLVKEDGRSHTQLYPKDHDFANQWVGMLYDPKTKSQYRIGQGRGFVATEGLLKYYKDKTKSQSVIGFHIAKKPPMSMFGFKRMHGRKPGHWEKYPHEKAMKSKLNKQKYLTTDKTAYDQLFVIKALTIAPEDEALNVEADVSHRKLVTAFKRMRSKKLSQRPMLSKFMDLVA